MDLDSFSTWTEEGVAWESARKVLDRCRPSMPGGSVFVFVLFVGGGIVNQTQHLWELLHPEVWNTRRHAGSECELATFWPQTLFRRPAQNTNEEWRSKCAFGGGHGFVDGLFGSDGCRWKPPKHALAEAFGRCRIFRRIREMDGGFAQENQSQKGGQVESGGRVRPRGPAPL